VDGQQTSYITPRNLPVHVVLRAGLEGKQVTILMYALLEELIQWRWPDALWTEIQPLSNETAIVTILDLNYGYTEWVASLSLDKRWTLSPRHGPWEHEQHAMR
jgi:hypothetical protein